MHPPTFRYQQRLSDWPDCSVEVRCPHCRHVVIYTVPILMRQGDRTFLELTYAEVLVLRQDAGAGLSLRRPAPDAAWRIGPTN